MTDYIVNTETKSYTVSINANDTVVINDKDHQVKLSKLSDYSYLLKVDNKIYQITSERNGSNNYTFTIDGFYYDISVRTLLEEKAFEHLKNKAQYNHNSIVKSPMPGLVLKIKKNVGDQVEIGESLIILEAMKMENDIRASISGVIKEIPIKENSAVEKNETLVVISNGDV